MIRKALILPVLLNFCFPDIPSFGSDTTFDVATWNIEWFPKNGQQTVNYVTDIIESLDFDIIAVQEVDEKETFNNMIDAIPNYSSLTENSMWNNSHGLAYVYRNDRVTINDAYDIYYEDIYHQIFLRSPMVLDVYFENKNYILINNHLKCCGDGILDMSNENDYEYLRWMAMNYLKDYVDSYFPESRVVILGDFNDDITEPSLNNVFNTILNDNDNYLFADMEISLGDPNNWSFPAPHPIVPWPSQLDHLLLTNELFEDFTFSNAQTIIVDDYLENGWSEYDQNVSDHRPVAMRLFFPAYNDPPTSFALLSPADGLEITTDLPLLSWQASSDADLDDELTYVVQIGTSISDQISIPVDTEIFFQFSDRLLDNTPYYWTVFAQDNNNAQTSNIGGYHSFIINTANDAPSIVSTVAPIENSIQMDLTPDFYWTESQDPDPNESVTYTLSLWELGSEEMQTIETDSNGVTLGTILSDNSEYLWRVKAMDLSGAQSLSEISNFFTDAYPEPPDVFSTLSPADEAEGMGIEVDFIWEEAIDPDPLETIYYRLAYVTRSEDWYDTSLHVVSDPIFDTNITLTLEDNNQYFWGVIAKDSDGFIVTSNGNEPNSLVIGTLSFDEDLFPEVFALYQNYPNPFNPTTQINYDLPGETLVNIKIYDVMGRSIRTLMNTNQTTGYHSIRWDAKNDIGEGVAAGMYIYTIQAGKFRATRKMVLLK